MLTEAFNTIFKCLATIKNKNGETQSPYLKLLLNLNFVVGLPITRTRANTKLMHSIIYFFHISRNNFFTITSFNILIQLNPKLFQKPP